MKVKVLVVQSCPMLCKPMDCSPPGSPIHVFLQARKLEWVAIPFSRGSSHPGSPALQVDSLLSEPPGKPIWANFERQWRTEEPGVTVRHSLTTDQQQSKCEVGHFNSEEVVQWLDSNSICPKGTLELARTASRLKWFFPQTTTESPTNSLWPP